MKIIFLLFLGTSLFASQPVWYGDNWAKLEQMMKKYGKSSRGYNAKHKPVATFDWDNTVLKNDAGDATMFWMVAHDLIKKPEDWAKTSAFLTKDAIEALNKKCRDGLSSPLPTSKNAECADLVLSIYDSGKLPDEKTAAWEKTFNSDTIEPSYAWLAELTAGYTPHEVRKFAKEAMDFNMGNPIGTKQKIGTKNYTAYVRIYDQIKKLISELQKNGFDVWIVTASPQFIIEVYAREVGIERKHVIGIRSKMIPREEGCNVASYTLEGCGTHPDGNQTMISYRQGKRCWINKVIFSVKDPKEMMEKRSPTIFAAGDSDTDVFFLKDARERLVINRNKPELMCNAYAGHWIINPMFIEPKPQGPAYKCRKYGLPDQVDTVF